jgi:aminocarboxymuconate-semialdehyde decarboxylase
VKGAEKYLGDSAFEAIWAELDLRQAVVFINPCHSPRRLASLDLWWTTPFHTTRTAVQLVLNSIVTEKIMGGDL